MTSTFAITAPATTVHLAENRLGEMPFTVTNMTDRPVRAQVSVVPLDSAPPQWFSLVGSADIDLRPRASAQALVRVEPPLGAPAVTHLFRVDVTDAAGSDATRSVGPSCSVVVPPSQPTVNRWATPRGYLATLLGATAGGAVGELVILISVLARDEKECTDLSCALGEVILLVLAFLAGLVLLWIGSAIGTGIGLRMRRYLGAKLTALFLAILLIPWTIAMLALVSALNLPLVALLIVAPILLTSIPGVLARGAVLLIRTRHL